MAFPKADPQLTQFMEQSLAGLKTSFRPMFGCPAWFAGESMFAGVFGDLINLRLPPGPQQEQLMAAYPGAHLFKPFPGRPMREHVSIPGRAVKAGAAWQAWLKKSYDYAAGLPAKKKARKKG
ncbi:MAG: TfoX/Sxy family protein [Thermodesulfobacteriota bacterium]